MLVDRDILHAEISQHNLEKFEEEAKVSFPSLSPGQVLRLPFRTRKEGGIHHPYTLAGIPFPHRTEQSHVMLLGTTGSGQTTELRSLVTQMRKRQDPPVIFDLPGPNVVALYVPAPDTTLT